MFSKLLFYLIIAVSSLSYGCRIDGRIADGNGQGLPNVTVYLNSGIITMETTTDANGWFCFGDPFDEEWRLPPGNYLITPVKPGYCFSPENRTVPLTSQVLGDYGSVCMPASGVDFKSSNIESFVGSYYLDDLRMTYENGEILTKSNFYIVKSLLTISPEGNITYFLHLGGYSLIYIASRREKLLEIIDYKTARFSSKDCIFDLGFELYNNLLTITYERGNRCGQIEYPMVEFWAKKKLLENQRSVLAPYIFWDVPVESPSPQSPNLQQYCFSALD